MPAERLQLPGARIGYQTDPGVVRAENQDSLFVPEPQADVAGRGILVAVADGMGGRAGGALASRITVEALAGFYKEPMTGLPPDLMVLHLVENAHAALNKLSAQKEQLRGMGTTFTGILIVNGGYEVFHVGDSRAYLWRSGVLEQLTSDHTLAAKWEAQGKVALGSRARSVLTRALGAGTPLEIDRATREAMPGDRLLLCSDGLHGVLTKTQISDLLGVSTTPWEAAGKAITLTRDGGAPDNVTAVVVSVDWATAAS